MAEDTGVIVALKDFNRLMERDQWLSDLEEAGVDNWSGIDTAIDIKELREHMYGI